MNKNVKPLEAVRQVKCEKEVIAKYIMVVLGFLSDTLIINFMREETL